MPRDPDDGHVDRSLKPNALVWTGSTPPRSTGGMVAAVGMNEPTMPRLAVDPEGAASAPRGRRGRAADLSESERGAQVAVSPMEAPGDPRERKGGRFRMPKG
ncbi:MAG: hypothetical protein H6738_15670 [Alphaproteobacteria bacterium]|nr:hypothetical protein [Alphaproteobacteria bacterium]MCB9698217.1 hypothetical protein [Alphaproteobacteria bacterium]